MQLFIEFLQLVGIILGFFIALVLCSILQSKFMTEKEMADYADSWDEFLYGEKFR